jgi:hypothetical protein
MSNAMGRYKRVAAEYNKFIRRSSQTHNALTAEDRRRLRELSDAFSELVAKDEYFANIIWAFVRFEGNYVVLMGLHNNQLDRLSELVGDMQRTRWADLQRTPDGDEVMASFYIRDGEFYLEIHRRYFNGVCNEYGLHRFSSFNLQAYRNKLQKHLDDVDELLASMNGGDK